MEHQDLKILLIVDDKDYQEHLQDLLRAVLPEGHEIYWARGFDAALEMITATGIDMCFMDYRLGGHSGFELLPELTKAGCRTSIAFLTGRGNCSADIQSSKSGGIAYLPKDDVDMQSLERLIQYGIEQKRAEESERCQRMHLDAVLRSIGDGILTVDTGMRVTYTNDALQTMCSCFEQAQIGRLLKNIPCTCEGSCFAALDQVLRAQNPIRDYRIKCKKGSKPNQVVVLNSTQLLNQANQFQGAVLLVKDITRLEELERKLIEWHSFGNIIGKSKRMQEIYGLLESLANLETTVLITGESGTGKELIAEALHYGGIWSSGSLIKVNCSALPEGLLESELFGHVRGAFTGAVSDSTGRFEAAEAGTIFLDEIGDISPLTQVKLLRVLEQKEFERVGESKTRKARVRVVVATNADLLERVRRGLFREDLFYRLKVMTIHLPPLRERTEDIPLLTDHFISRMRDVCDKNITGVSAEVMHLFMDYGWPGNVRELRYTLEHACILCPGRTITLEHLPKDLKEAAKGKQSSSARHACAGVTEGEILEALERAEWNKARAARILGIGRRSLYRRIEQYGIKDRMQ